jgi:hypothetical protein
VIQILKVINKKKDLYAPLMESEEMSRKKESRIYACGLTFEIK